MNLNTNTLKNTIAHKLFFEKYQKKRNFIPQLLSKKKRKLKETYQNINEKLLIIVYFCCSIKNLTKNVQ
jgi:hypothetical protein